MKLLITGASGFVGRSLLDSLASDGRFHVRGIVRQPDILLPIGVEKFVFCDLADDNCLFEALHEVDAVVHLAGRAHVLKEEGVDPLHEFRRVNVKGSVALARQAMLSGVRRFVFISSIGVNGNQTHGVPFTENDVPSPQEDYAVSKFEAETALRDIFADSLTELVVIRPPLVYGPGAPGNFGRLLGLVSSRMVLPLGAINNKRSFVALDNLVDLIVTCLLHPSAANQTFLAGDGEDLSTTELLRRMGCAMGKPTRLFPLPSKLLELGAALLGKQALVQRLCGDLQVDISKARDLLGWEPPVSVDEGLRRSVVEFAVSSGG